MLYMDKICPNCGKKYICIKEQQTPGFRFTEEEKCPYCGHLITESLEYEFQTYKISE